MPGCSALPTVQVQQRSCSKGWDTSSWVTGATAGSRCTSSRYNSPYDCPALCTWDSALLQNSGQCAGLPPPKLPRSASGANATCLLHPPCSPAGGGEAGALDGPCYCCDLALDPSALAGSSTSSSAGTVPAGQLWVFFLGQLAFLVWVLFLTRSQVGGRARAMGLWVGRWARRSSAALLLSATVQR